MFFLPHYFGMCKYFCHSSIIIWKVKFRYVCLQMVIENLYLNLFSCELYLKISIHFCKKFNQSYKIPSEIWNLISMSSFNRFFYFVKLFFQKNSGTLLSYRAYLTLCASCYSYIVQCLFSFDFKFWLFINH